MQTQQLNELQGRALTIPVTVTGVSTTLPTPLANAMIGWNPTGTGLVNLAALAGAVALPLAIGNGGTGQNGLPASLDALMSRGGDIVAVANLNLDNVTGDLIDVTGNTGITAITLAAGKWRTIRFTGTPLITNGASLVLPGGINLQAAAGDLAVWRGYAGGIVRCVSYQRASGLPVVTGSPAQALVDAAAVTVDFASGGVCTLTATNAVGNTRAIGAPSSIKQGGRYVFVYTQDATGNRALTWNAVFKADGITSIPPADPQPNAVTTYTFTSPDGVNLRYEGREAMVLLATGTAANSSSLDFTNLTGFNSYLFVVESLVPATNNTDLWLRISQDNGATFQAGAGIYHYCAAQAPEAGPLGVIAQSAGDTKILVAGNISSTASRSLGADISVGALDSATVFKNFRWAGGYFNSGASYLGVWGGGAYLADAGAINAIRFLMSSGNISTGTIKCYGRRG